MSAQYRRGPARKRRPFFQPLLRAQLRPPAGPNRESVSSRRNFRGEKYRRRGRALLQLRRF